MAKQTSNVPRKNFKAPADPAVVMGQFRTLINKELKKINADTHPIIFAKTRNRAGYLLMEEAIITMCIQNNMTPSVVIGQLESSYENN